MENADEINKRNTEYWNKRNAVQAKLLSDPETAQFLADTLKAEADLFFRYRESASKARIAEEKLRRIVEGPQNREDQKARVAFTAWVRTNKFVIARIGDLWNIQGFEWGKYSKITLKGWYKSAMPNVELKPGRPQK